MYHIFFIHSSVDGHLCCYHVLAIAHSASVNTGVHVTFQAMFLSRYMPRSGIAGSHGSLMLSCVSCLYMVNINALSVILFANTFSHSVGCLFILLMVSFAMQKVLSLIRSHLFIFVFFPLLLRDGSHKIFLEFMSKSVLPMFSYGVLQYLVLYLSL